MGAQLPRNPRRKGSFQQLQTTPPHPAHVDRPPRALRPSHHGAPRPRPRRAWGRGAGRRRSRGPHRIRSPLTTRTHLARL